MLWHFTDFENFRFWFIGDSKCADIWAAFEFMLTITHIGDCSSKHLTKKINNGKDIKLDLYNSNTDNQTRNLRQQGKMPMRCVRKPLICLIWFYQSVRDHDDGKIWISLENAWWVTEARTRDASAYKNSKQEKIIIILLDRNFLQYLMLCFQPNYHSSTSSGFSGRFDDFFNLPKLSKV